MATWNQWVEGARPRTLPAAIAPVAAGTGAAWQLGAHEPLRAVLALIVSLALQVGVNYANDYSDGVRGTDDVRVGPFRLTASKAAPPELVRAAAFAAFGVAAVAGFVLVALCGAWWLLAVGVACVLAAWFYTGGRRPYGYAGLGEVFVFVFFGLVAVLGTTYTQAGRVSWEAGAAAVGIGLLACAILVVNNLRDVPTDAVAGKRTLAVRLGERRTRTLYVVMILAGVAVGPVVAAALGAVEALAGLLAFGLAWRPVRVVLSGGQGRELLPVLRDTGRTELALGLLLGLGLAFAA